MNRMVVVVVMSERKDLDVMKSKLKVQRENLSQSQNNLQTLEEAYKYFKVIYPHSHWSIIRIENGGISVDSQNYFILFEGCNSKFSQEFLIHNTAFLPSI